MLIVLCTLVCYIWMQICLNIYVYNKSTQLIYLTILIPAPVAFCLPIPIFNWIPLIYFSGLITITSASNTIMNISGEKGQHCFVPVLGILAFIFFSIEYKASNGLVVSGFNYMEESLLNSIWLKDFIKNWSTQMLSFHLLIRLCGVCFFFYGSMYYIYQHLYIKPSLHTWNDSI